MAFRLLPPVQRAFHDPTHIAYPWIQGAVWFLIVVSIVLLGVELALPADHALQGTIDYADTFLLWFFVVEFVLRVLVFHPPEVDFFAKSTVGNMSAHVWGRVRYCLEPLNLIDLLTILAVVPALRGLRALRFLRLVRTIKVFRYANPLEGVARAFRDNGLLFGFAISAVLLATMIGGTSLYFLERQNNENVQTLSDGLWWAIVTLTTVGYGDISPATGLGKIVAAALMIFGMFVLALFAGIVGNTLLNTVMTIREEQFRVSNYLGHIVVCGYDPGARMLLDTIETEFGEEPHELLLFSRGERPPDVPPKFMWVSGDPTKESELDKVKLTHANVVVVVAPRGLSPQQADAQTILTVFTIRSYMEKHAGLAKARVKPLHVLAEILDPENVSHAQTAGADEVIETTRLGFSALAHAVAEPGTGSVLAAVAAFGSNSLFVGAPPKTAELPMSFAEMTKAARKESGALLIGVHDPSAHVDHINPPDSFKVQPGHRLIYLAPQAVLPEAT